MVESEENQRKDAMSIDDDGHRLVLLVLCFALLVLRIDDKSDQNKGAAGACSTKLLASVLHAPTIRRD